MKRSASSGQCGLCGGTFSKASMTRHLTACLDKTAAAQAGSVVKPLKVFHILVEGRYQPEYWMHLEVPVAAKLQTLDQFLRGIWLECCGHMSAFTIAKVTYSSSPSPESIFGGAREQSMAKKLYTVLTPGMPFDHEYDFGSTTNLKLKVAGERTTKNSGEITILARNNPPLIKCEKCGKPATQVCSGCSFNEDAWFCDACAPDHECGEEMMLPVTNSPRVGICGYTG